MSANVFIHIQQDCSELSLTNF